jgi:hypothetical protein
VAAAVPLLIQVGIAVGTSVASSMLAPKPKLNPVDKGRFDDIRFTTAEEGAFIPLCFGQRVRLAGNIIWGTVTHEYVTRDPGRTGGKGGGGGQQATPPTNTYSYKKSFAIMVCGTPVKSYRRISENLEAIYNNLGSEIREDFYEAENHALSGGAVIVTDGDCSGGRAVRLSGSAHNVQVAVSVLSATLHTVVVFYKASAPAQVYLSANGGGETLISLPATGDLPAAVTATLLLGRGANFINLRGGTGTSDVDRIYISATGVPDPEDPIIKGRELTNLIDVDADFPGDPDNPAPFYNAVQAFDADGYFEGFTTAGGQARFELFAGKETQPQSAIIVAVEGASETPAFRDVSYFAVEDYLLREGQLGNFIFEIEPEIQDLDETLLYLYTLDGKVTAADCDFSLLAGRKISGLVLDHRAPLSEWVTALESWFNFDIVPRGGKITAVPRGGAVVTRLYERELRAHFYGEERPRAAVKITHETALDLPGAVDVIYLDSAPSKDFHSGNQTAEKIVGFAFDRETLTFPLVGDADTAHAVGLRFLDALHLAAKPGSLVCGFGKRHYIPTDIIECELEDGTLHTYRVTTKQADLQGMVKFGVVPERPSIYGQNGAGVSGRGGDVLIIRGLANTLLVVADSVALRQEDFGRLVLYGAACPRGRGQWPGYHLVKKDQNDEYERVGGFQEAATIGIVETASQSAVASGYDAARSFVVKLYFGTLESRTLDEVRAERVNLALYGSGTRWEVLQFLSVTPQTPTDPFVAQYLVTGTVAGQLGSGQHSRNHQDGDYFVLVDTAVKSFPVPPADLNQELTFIGQTAGQALADAESVSSVTLTLFGASRRYDPPANLRLSRLDGSPSSPLLCQWDKPPGAELSADERYVWKAWDSATLLRTHTVQGEYSEPLQAQALTTGEPGENPSLLTISEDGTLELGANADEFASVRASQRIIGDSRISWRLDSRNPPFFLGIEGAWYPFDINQATDEIMVVDHYFEEGDEFLPQSGIPTGIYYVVNPTSDTFQIAATPGGTSLDLSAFSAGEFAYPAPAFSFVEGVESGGVYYVRPALAGSFQVPAVAGAEYAIEMRVGVAYFFLINQQNPKFVSSSSPTRWPYTVRVTLGFLGGAEQAAVGVAVRHTNPRSFLYTRGMQGNDSAPTPIRVTVSRLSAGGEGLAAEATG